MTTRAPKGRQRKLRAIAASLLLFLTTPQAAHACTVCSSGTGKEVRAGIFQNDFASTFLKVILPIPALAFGVAVATRWLTGQTQTNRP